MLIWNSTGIQLFGVTMGREIEFAADVGNSDAFVQH